jgi:hypothetical protein
MGREDIRENTQSFPDLVYERSVIPHKPRSYASPTGQISIN